MNRRDFFRAAGVGLGLIGAPHLIRDAFAADVDPLEEVETLSAAFQRAHERGVPMLVLVIPEDPGRRWFAGHAFGELLMHGPDATLARLTQVELVCARMESLRLLVPSAPKGEPHMVLVQTDRVPAPSAAVKVDLGSEEAWWGDSSGVDTRIEAQAKALDRLLPAVADEGRNAETFKARLRERVPGSHWASEGGCGTTIEGVENQRMYACGMGHVPQRSRRFLYFFDPDELVY